MPERSQDGFLDGRLTTGSERVTMNSKLTARLHDLDWNLLKVFHEIVQAGGISPAAPRLNLKQPAISLALKRLEKRVGSLLCRRGPAGFELSDEGQRVAEVCEEVNR